ncbi:hypothetical protein [Streptomyces sp. NPDC056105]|uniref:hypothetical protein n=1 Tax=Streptomyces sp. NPDC056105 TaxID=3345714 RepID=UPI0035DE6265
MRIHTRGAAARRAQDDDNISPDEVALVDVTINAVVAIVAVFGLLLSGVGSLLQWRTTKDQLEQSYDAKGRDLKEQAALFDARVDGDKIFMVNYSPHTIRSVDTYVRLGASGKKELFFNAPDVPPCTSVTYQFRAKKAGKSVIPDLYLNTYAYKDWEGRYWTFSGGEGLIWVDYQAMLAKRKKAQLMMSWEEMLKKTPRQVALSDCPAG